MQRSFGSVALVVALVVALLVAVMGPASLTARQLSLVIDATSPASPYSTDVGGRRVFICRPNLPIQPIWGTDVHTDDPSIAASATPRFKTRGEVYRRDLLLPRDRDRSQEPSRSRKRRVYYHGVHMAVRGSANV